MAGACRLGCRLVGLPFLLLWAMAGPLLGGRGLELAELARDAVLAVIGGVVFGLFICAVSSRFRRFP